MSKTARIVVLAFVFCTGTTFARAERLQLYPERDISLKKEAEAAVRRGIDWLCSQQKDDGSWQGQTAFTGLAVMAISSAQEKKDAWRACVDRGVRFILAHANEDGSIGGPYYKVYTTSICLSALALAAPEKGLDVIRRGRSFLMGEQWTESEDVGKNNPYYGGIGYGSKKRPDLSNLQFALEALKMTEFADADDPGREKERARAKLCWDRAIVFLSRCQNLKATNDQKWAKNDGGFIYRPGHSKAGDTRSYGSMTYAGLKSMIYAKLTRNDPRVKAALDWVRKHYTVDENPGMGDQGLFYSYQTMAKALHVAGVEILTDQTGMEHDWRVDLLRKLLTLQTGAGYWVNKNGRWMEKMPVLVTCYALIAMNVTLSGFGQ